MKRLLGIILGVLFLCSIIPGCGTAEDSISSAASVGQVTDSNLDNSIEAANAMNVGSFSTYVSCGGNCYIPNSSGGFWTFAGDGSGCKCVESNLFGVVNTAADGWLYSVDSRGRGQDKTMNLDRNGIPTVHRASPDGKTTELLFDYQTVTKDEWPISGILVRGDWIYLMSWQKGVDRVRTDGTDYQHIVDGKAICMDIHSDLLSGWICIVDAEQGTISRFALDGSDRQDLVTSLNDPSKCQCFTDGTWVYYGERQGPLFRVSADGGTPEQLVEQADYGFILLDGWLYYQHRSETEIDLFRTKTDGTGTVQLASVEQNENNSLCPMLFTTGDWIYYAQDVKVPGTIYGVTTDGTQECQIVYAK